MKLNTHHFGYSIFILFISGATKCITAQINTESDFVLDIGRISEDFLNTQNPVYHTLRSFIKIISNRNGDNVSSSHFLIHFKITLYNNAVQKFEKLIKAVDTIQRENQYFRPLLLLTIRFPYTGYYNKFFMENFPKLFQKLSNFASIIAGLSFEYPNISDSACNEQSFPQGDNIVTLVKRYIKQNKYTHSKVAEPMKVGYFVEHDQLSCRIHWESYEQIDFLIVNVVFNRPQTFIESYGIFCNYMKNVETSLKNLKAITKPSCKKVFYRLVLERTNGVGKIWMESLNRAKINQSRIHNFTNKISKKYEKLFLEYALQWSINEDGNTKIVILDQVNDVHVNASSLSVNLLNETVTATSRIIPMIKGLPKYRTTLDNNSAVLFDKSMKNFFSTISSSGYTSLYFLQDELTKLASHLNTEGDRCSTNACQSGLNFYTDFDPTKSPDEFDTWLNGLPLKIRYGMLLNSYYWYRDLHPERKARNINKTKKFVHEVSKVSKVAINVSLGCAAWFDFFRLDFDFTENEIPAIKMVGQIIKDCELIVNNTDIILAFTELEFSKAIQRSSAVLMSLLDQFAIAHQILTDMYPEKTILLELIPLSERDGQIKGMKEKTLYCNPEATSIWLGYDAILSWAAIYEIPIILQTRKWLWNNPVEWRMLKLLPDKYQELVKTYPIFLRRSYNESRMIGEWKGDMLQCVKKSSKGNYQPISFLHGFSGVTLTLDVRQSSLDLQEVQTMLYFSFAKFTKIELVNLTDTKLEMLIQAVSDTQFSKHLSTNNILPNEIQLFLEISIPISNDKIFELINKFVILLQSLKFQVYLYIELKDSKKLNILRKMINGTIPIGVFIENCVEEAEKIFFTTNWTSQKQLQHNLNNFNFLICQTDDQVADNADDLNMQKYLDSHYYLKSVFHMLFPNLRGVYFRLNAIIFAQTSQSTLHFLADANNYASSYKTNFFLLSAFSSSGTPQNKMSWWEITNYTDMTNTSVYFEHEANYLNNSQWTPTLISDIHSQSVVNEGQTDTMLAWALSATVLVSIVLMLLTAALAKRVKQNSTILTDEEVKEFLNGKKLDDLELTDVNAHIAIFEMLGYKIGYEIDKNCISVSTKNVIGFGHFGIVYSGSIRNNVENWVGRPENVAVKMPRNGCTKEILKSMLSEVKILCYIGEHGNLVRFIGCYTKEISRGVLWVVMELCDGGTVQSYLKHKKVSINDAGVILPELVRLCREIACGMEYIANQKVVHGDLSARNVLLDKYNICKIGDFGLSRKLYEYQTYVKQNEGPMPWRWMAYESLETMKFSTYSDVWSFGVTGWEIFTLGDLPYPGVNWDPEFVKELQNGKRLGKPGFAAQDIYEMLLRCWNLEIDMRPTFSDLVAYFTDLVPYSDVL